jgi:hypothetical protein
LNSQEWKAYLELELQSKSSEVTGKSLSIAKQSEMIESIQNFRFGNRFKQTEARLKDDKNQCC